MVPTDYEMYTPEGDAAVAAFVRRVSNAITDRTLVERCDAVDAVLAGVDELARTKAAAEVRDTEPRWNIVDALAPAFASRGWLPPDDVF